MIADISPKFFNELTWCDPILEATEKILKKTIVGFLVDLKTLKLTFEINRPLLCGVEF